MLIPAIALAVSLAQAQPPSFEVQLDGVRQAFVHALQDARSASIEEAARKTQGLDSVVGQKRWTVQDIRRRAAWINPSRGRDWFFEADLQRLRHDLSDLAFRARTLETDISRLARETPADPANASAAAKLSQAARGLRVEAGRLADDGRWAGHELRRAGYPLEGEETARSCAAVLMSAFHIEDAAKRLQRRVN